MLGSGVQTDCREGRINGHGPWWSQAWTFPFRLARHARQSFHLKTIRLGETVPTYNMNDSFHSVVTRCEMWV